MPSRKQPSAIADPYLFLFQYLYRTAMDSIINTGKIRLYNLEKDNSTGNDINEYSLFLKKNKIKLPGGSNQISKIKDSIFILCLTDLPSEKHWKNYANNGEGVMASFHFKKMNDTSVMSS